MKYNSWFLVVSAVFAFSGCNPDPTTQFERAAGLFKKKESALPEPLEPFREGKDTSGQPGYGSLDTSVSNRRVPQSFYDEYFADVKEPLRKTIAAAPEFVPAYLLLGRIAALSNDGELAAINYRNAYDYMRLRKFEYREEDIRAQESDLKLHWAEGAFFLADREFSEQNYNRAIVYYDTILADDRLGALKPYALEQKHAVQEFLGLHERLELLRVQNRRRPDDPKVKAEIAALLMELVSGLTRMGKTKAIADQVLLATNFRVNAEANLKEIYAASPEVRLKDIEALLAFVASQENLMRGKFEEALENSKQASELGPNDAKYQFSVTSILTVLARGKNDPEYALDERMDYARKAVELEPESWRYLSAYAGLLRQAGRFREAFEFMLDAKSKTQEQEIRSQIDDYLADLEARISEGADNAQPSPPTASP